MWRYRRVVDDGFRCFISVALIIGMRGFCRMLGGCHWIGREVRKMTRVWYGTEEATGGWALAPWLATKHKAVLSMDNCFIMTMQMSLGLT